MGSRRGEPQLVRGTKDGRETWVRETDLLRVTVRRDDGAAKDFVVGDEVLTLSELGALLAEHAGALEIAFVSRKDAGLDPAGRAKKQADLYGQASRLLGRGKRTADLILLDRARTLLIECLALGPASARAPAARTLLAEVEELGQKLELALAETKGEPLEKAPLCPAHEILMVLEKGPLFPVWACPHSTDCWRRRVRPLRFSSAGT